jgi:hypothetical protein
MTTAPSLWEWDRGGESIIDVSNSEISVNRDDASA